MASLSSPEPEPALGGPVDLAALTGVRSGKQTYYSAYQRADDRLQRTVAAMDSISGGLVHLVEGPRALLERVVRVVARHLAADWAVLALSTLSLPGSRPRFLMIDADGVVRDDLSELPRSARRAVMAIFGRAPEEVRVDDEDGVVWAPMLLEGESIGAVAVRPGSDLPVEPADLSVLRILANLAAVSLYTADLYHRGLAQQRRAQQLFDEVSEQARMLSSRTAELRSAEQRLRVADQRELLESERRRIALELHDSVAQTVLGAGLALEVLRDDLAGPGEETPETAELDRARELIARATEQLRSVIYALHHQRTAEDVASLPELLAEVASQHRPHLGVRLRVEGRAVPLGTSAEHALARTAGEALFNVAMHAGATRAYVTLRYLPGQVVLRVSDDGHGDPAAMRRTVRLARRGTADGRHRGLVGMAMRAEGLGGTFRIRRSRAGGVSVESRIPITAGTVPAASTEGET